MESGKLLEVLKTADLNILEEICRESELKLEAQLQSGLAADQRAFTYLGFLVAISVVVIGASFSLIIKTPQFVGLSGTALLFACGIIYSCAILYQSARPVDWRFVGNEPNKWVGDIKNSVTLTQALASQCAHYDKALILNKVALDDAADKVASATKVLFATFTISGLLGLFFWFDYAVFGC